MMPFCACLILIFVAGTTNGQNNVALHAKATQTSTWKGIYDADRAVDGNTGKNFFKDTCSHTECDDKNPSWTVCLKQMHTINSVTIHNPIEAHGRLKDIRIEVFTTDPSLPGAAAQVCATVTSTPVTDGIQMTFTCPLNMRGQYIRISKTIPQRRQWSTQHECDSLLLCEVEVDGTPFINCPLGFTAQLGSCYHISQMFAESWFEARIGCQTLGGDLAVIESQEEDAYISAQLLLRDPNGNANYYAGLHKLADGMTWRWIDPNAVMGVPAGPPNGLNPYSNWVPGQGNFPGFNCLLYIRNFNNRYEWFDEMCNEDHFYVCEISPTFPEPTRDTCNP